MIIPPRASAVLSTDNPDAQSPRDRHIRLMAERGRIGWQQATGYGRRNRAETTMGRYKHLIGPKLRARTLQGQQGEVAIAVTVLNRMIQAGYERLGLITFFTAGPKEARAWTTHRGAKAPEAAGEIHTDFERGFIRAETIAFDDYVAVVTAVSRRGAPSPSAALLAASEPRPRRASTSAA